MGGRVVVSCTETSRSDAGLLVLSHNWVYLVIGFISSYGEGRRVFEEAVEG